jgi:Na+/alanine symporter
MRIEIVTSRLNANERRCGSRRGSRFEWAGLGSDAACNQKAREDRCSEKGTHGLAPEFTRKIAVSFATTISVLLAARWTARSVCSIKYEFIVATAIASHLDANPAA